MTTLTKKVDFAVILEVNNANPNGDPLNGNRPRINYEGYGEISDVCIKRKLRNRFIDRGHMIFVQSDDYRVDEYDGLRKRAEGELGSTMKDRVKMSKVACEKWLDVRSFGQVFAYKGKDSDSISVGIRGPVSIHPAFSVAPINITSTQITKSVSDEGDGSGKRGSDTMGMKHRVDHGVYVFYGSINTQLAAKTGFTDEDAEEIKQSLIHLFNNDASSARPEGSMEVHKVIWWEHPNSTGRYSSARVHRALHIDVKEDITDPKSLEDYDISIEELDDIKTDIYQGL